MTHINFFLLTIFVFVITNIYSQSFYPKESLELAQVCNEAEWQIVSNNMEGAKHLYDSLFTKTSYNPSARDLWNRAMLAQNMNESATVDSIVRILIDKGYDIEKIKRCYPESVKKISLGENYYTAVERHKKFAADLIKADQANNRTKNENPELFIQTELDNIYKIMQYQNWVDSIGIKYFSIETAKFQVCLTHYFQLINNRDIDTSKLNNPPRYLKYLRNVDFKEQEVIDFLKAQVMKGHFNRQSFAELLSMSTVLSRKLVSQYNNYVFVTTPEFYLKKNLLELIDSTRNFYGLNSYNEYYQTAEYLDSQRGMYGLNKPIVRDSIPTYVDYLNNICSYDFITQYRTIMFFKNDEEAYKLYKRNFD